MGWWFLLGRNKWSAPYGTDLLVGETVGMMVALWGVAVARG